MGTKIISKNQSGGIAAQNVNWDNHQVSQNKEPKKKNPWKVVISIILVLAAIVTVLAYFRINP